MKKLFLTILLGCASLLAITAQTQSDSLANVDQLNLSLEDAKSMAIERNRTLMNASLDTKIAEANKWKAISSMLLQVNGSLDYSNMLGYTMDFNGMPISMPPSGQVGVNAAFALSGAQVASTQLAKISVDMANINIAKTEQDIVNQVRTLYYSALVSEQTIELLEKNLESIKKLHGFAQKSADVGVTEQVDADQILVQVGTMETTTSSSKRALEMIMNSVKVLLNIPADAELSLSDEIDDLLNVDTAMSLINEEFIMDYNYAYQLLQKSTELSKKQVLMSKWAFGPQLSVFYQYTGKKYFSDKKTLNMTPPNMMGVKLAIPIFSSGARLAGVKEAKVNYQKQLNTLSETENNLSIQHKQLIYNLSSAYERYNGQVQNVDVTQRVFDNYSVKFEYGTASSMDVTTAGTNLIAAQTSYVQSLLEFVNAQIALEQLLNKQ